MISKEDTEFHMAYKDTFHPREVAPGVWDYNPLNDAIFRFMFGKEQNKRFTIDLLNKILADELGREIRNLTFAPSEMTPEEFGGKGSRFDVACTLDDNEMVDIEVQITNKDDIRRRAQYYLSRLFFSQLKEGQIYRKLNPVIVVNFLAFSLFEEDEEPISFWQMRNAKTHRRLNKDFCIAFIEMPKLLTRIKSGKKLSQAEQWLVFLSRDIPITERKELISMENKIINEAVGTANTFFKNPAEFKRYVDQEILRMDRDSEIDSALNRGIAQGTSLGEEKVILGMMRNKLPLEVIASSSSKSLEALRKIAAANGLSV